MDDGEDAAGEGVMTMHDRPQIEAYIAKSKQLRANAVRRWAIRAATKLRNAWIAMWGRWRITVQIDRVEEPR
jgi:hypothetical protein